MYGVSIIPTKKGNDSRRWGIQTVQDQRISVTKTSVNLIKEYRNYLFEQDSSGRFIPGETTGDDHALDAARYALMSVVPSIQRKEIIDNMPILMNPEPRINPAI